MMRKSVIQTSMFSIFVAQLLILPIACGIGSRALAEDVVSGLRVGELAQQFLVKDCTGPAAGKTLCYYCRYADRPVVALFVRELNDELADMVLRLDQSVGEHQKDRSAAFVVLLDGDTDASEQHLKQVAKQHRLKHTPLTIYRDAPEKLTEIYRLAPEAAVTAIVWKRGKVVLNRAYADSHVRPNQVREFVTAFESALQSPDAAKSSPAPVP
jgi:hypothetical protein